VAGIPEIVIPVRLPGRELRLTAWFRDTADDLVMFVHGQGCSKKNFHAAWQRPELRECSLLAPDLPGFGRSPRPAEFSYRLQDHARVLAALIDTFASRRIHLVAHSMGGTIALLLSRRILSRMASLILVEPRLMTASSGLARDISRMGLETFRDEYLPRFRRRYASDPDAPFDLDRADPAGFYRSACSMVECLAHGDMMRRFREAPCEKLFVYGSLNRHLPELAGLAPADVTEIANAGHFVMLDNADGFYSLIGHRVSLPAR